MAASVMQQTRMCLNCFVRIGLQARYFSSRISGTANLLGLPTYSKSFKISTPGLVAAQQRHMSVLYFLLKSYEKEKKKKHKEGSPRFTTRYGIEGAIARELISQGANVHFTNGKWYGRKSRKSWFVTYPGPEATAFTINAIDAQDSFVNQGSLENMVNTLENVKYLNLDGCKYVDDHCLASLVHLRESLTHLSINRCNQITDGGLANLHKLRKLKKLNMNDLPLVANAKLVAIMLEDILPDIRIGMVTVEIEALKKRTKLFEDPEKNTREIDGATKTGKDGLLFTVNGESTSPADETDETKERSSIDKTADSGWEQLISEKTQRT